MKLTALSLLVGAGIAAAQPAPYHHYRTLETPHFRVTVPRGLEREGRVAGAAAEKAYAQLAKELKEPRGPIDLVVSDDADYSNGSATPFPNNRIIVYATPPIENEGLRLNEDWLALVITHELAHVFHLDRTRGVWSVAQSVFGRAPGLFPNAYGPSWITEGLAVYYESRFTEGGRLKDAEHRLIARAAAAERKLPQLGDLSLSSPVFPGGSGTYSYGSLFIDWLARARGDTTIRNLVDRQSGSLIPWRLNRLSRGAFGVTFQEAFGQWRDSVQRSIDAPAAPLPGWRELTRHGYYALDPRWRSDSSLVYWANAGRSTSAAYELALDGTRRWIGRRNSAGASVPLRNGGLLFAQLEVSSTAEIRSDLWVDRGGVQRRLTHGMRLVQPDARADGHIVAVQIGPTRTSLVLLDSSAAQHRLLRSAGPDETWSEPRWSPDGMSIAAIHRTHGGVFSLEVIDIATGGSTVVDQGRSLIASPSWEAGGQTLVYTSEESGEPLIMRAGVASGERARVSRATGGTGVFTPELSPSGARMAVVALRADGYHVGVVSDFPRDALTASAATPAQAAPADTQPLAPGTYRDYSALASLVPRYWFPIIEDAPSGGARLGASTSGRDVVGRHLYDANATVSTKGVHPTASIVYRYAGLRRPYVDVNLLQDFTREATLTNGGTTDDKGYILRRTRFGALSATFARPKIRTFTSLSLGGGLEERAFVTNVPEFLPQLPAVYSRKFLYPSAFVGGQWSNLQRPSLSISPEDGISLGFTARVRTRTDSMSKRASASVVGTASGFKSLDLPGFAHHVLALRVAGGVADRRAASGFEVGGTSGGTIEIIPTYTVGEGRRTFGVRGFPGGALVGTTAYAGTLEYRAPVSLGGRGFGSLPLFFDRSSVSGFVDAGRVGCASSLLNPGVCSPAPLLERTIASAGAELVLTAAILDWDVAQRIRLGVAAPFMSRELAERSVSAYVAYGLSF